MKLLGEQSRKEKALSKSDESPLVGRTMADYLDIEADRESYRLEKFGKLLAGPNTDLEALRRLGWAGIPAAVRATTWQLLLVRLIHWLTDLNVFVKGYLPSNIDRREETLKRKRTEYKNYIEQYYHNRNDAQFQPLFKQVVFLITDNLLIICNTDTHRYTQNES